MNMDEQQLPPGWVEAKIDELLPPLADGKTMHQGWSPRCDGGPATSDDEWAVLKTTSIQDGEFKPQHNKKIPSHLPPRHRLEVKTGDLLITSAGPRIRCGVPCLVRQTRPRLMISGKMYRFRAPQELDSVYFESVLRSPLLQKAIDEIKTGIDESGLNLTHERFRDLTIPIPPLPEQRRIVAKIEALQERSGRAAKALEEVGPLLEQFRQSILAAAFSGRLTADWREKNPNVEPAHELLARIRTERRHRWEQAELAKYEAKGKQPPKDWKDKYEEPEPVDETNLPELPEGWCWARAEEVCEYITKGTTPPTEKMTQDRGEVRFLKVGNLTFNGLLDFTKENAYIDHDTHNAGVYSRSRILPGDVLMNLVGPPLGKVSIIPPEIEHSNVNQAIAIFRPIAGIQPRYLMLALTTPSILQRILERAKQTSGQRNLTLELARGLPVPLAPYQEQNEIIRLSQLSLNVFTSLEMALPSLESDLTQLNQSILAKAFRGELVPQDPNDEPASELLARIQKEREASGDSVQGSGRKKKARGNGNASESARPAKRSKRSSKAASAATPEPSADTSPEPARPQRRRRDAVRETDPTKVIDIIAEGDGTHIHAEVNGTDISFYTRSGWSMAWEIDDAPEEFKRPRESARVPTLQELLEPELALFYPTNVNLTYLPQLQEWYVWAVSHLRKPTDAARQQRVQQDWLDALQLSPDQLLSRPVVSPPPRPPKGGTQQSLFGTD